MTRARLLSTQHSGLPTLTRRRQVHYKMMSTRHAMPSLRFRCLSPASLFEAPRLASRRLLSLHRVLRSPVAASKVLDTSWPLLLNLGEGEC